jgi:hypothetical protein
MNMAVNSSRSQSADLREGATDGKYRKARPDTAVAPMTGDEITRLNREHLHAPMNYGFVNQQIPLDQRAIPGS